MTTEYFEEFADRFVSEVTSYFIKIDRHKVKITSDCIKIQMYSINFNEIVFFSFDGKQRKLTVKWLKVLDKY